MKAREFIRDHVVPAGGQFVRRVGDHHVYRLPSGHFFNVPVGGRQTEVAQSLVFKLRRLTKERAHEKDPL